MKKNKINILDSLILKRYHLNRQFYNWQSIEAMSIIGTAKYNKLLNSDLNNKKIDDDKKKFIKRALAKMGDIDICKKVLSKAEELESFPFKISGGDKDLWFKIPLKLRLDFARKRIKAYSELLNKETYISNHKDGCNLSLQNLRTIGGTNEDVEIAKQIIENSNDYNHCFYAYFLILVNKFQDNTDYLIEKLKIFGFEEQYDVALQAKKFGIKLLSDEDIEFSIKALNDIILLKNAVKDKNKMDIDFDKLKALSFEEPKIIDYLKKEIKKNREIVIILDSMYRKISTYLKSIKNNEIIQELVFCKLQANELIQSDSSFWDIAKKI